LSNWFNKVNANSKRSSLNSSTKRTLRMMKPFPTRRSPSSQLLDVLRARFGTSLSTSHAVLMQHGTDESHYQPVAPDAVVFAKSSEDVAFIVTACAKESVPIIAFGVGSSIEGHLLAVEGGVCINLSEMNKVIAIHADDLSATVQAGVTREQLNRELGQSGYFFSVDPGANASIGGMTATAASGTNSVRYGTMRDNVLGLTVVTAEGEIIRTSARARKSSAGYNLTQLYCGSEGTLGVITEVTVRLHPHPEKIAAAVVNFKSTRDAVSAVIQAMQLGVPLARAEMLDALTIKAINAHSKTTLTEAPTLFLEFAGSTSQVDEQAAIVREIVDAFGGGQFQWATQQEERSKLWTPRHHAYFACLQLKPGSKSFTTDACVPISALADCLTETVEDVETCGLPVPIFGHVGDGNFHCLILVDPSNQDEVDRAEALSERLILRAIKHGGTCTGEHGIGLHKIGYLEIEHGKATVDIMRRVKLALDPKNICNPGKVVRLHSSCKMAGSEPPQQNT
jgi:D-lactate dehydrogenase (cytochrome)